MLSNKGMLSKLIKIFLYGVINFAVVLILISITKYNSQVSFQTQLIPMAIIIFATGLVNYIIVDKKLL